MLDRVRAAVAAALLLCSALPLLALEGQVVDASGQPVAGARVAVVGRPGSTVSGPDGRFVLVPDPALPFELAVSDPEAVALPPIPVREIPSSGLVVRLYHLTDEVTVITGAIPDVELPPADAATVLGRADLEERRPARLADALENIPGVGRLDEGASVVPSLRGLARSRTLIMIDGARVTAERRAGPSASFLDPDALDEVEVIRGPGSVAYGSEAFGGVIRTVSRLPRPGDGPAVRWRTSGATAGGERGAAFEYTTDLLGGAVLVGGQARRWNDYESARGTILNSAGEARGARLGWRGALLRGTLRATFAWDESLDVGKPGADVATVQTTYPEERSRRASLQYEQPGPGSWSRLSATVAWDDYRIVTVRDAVATRRDPRTVQESDIDARDLGLRLEAERPVGPLRLVTGLDVSGRYGLHAIDRKRTFDGTGAVLTATENVAVGNARRTDFGLFAGLSGEKGRFGWSAGMRGDRVETRNGGGVYGDRSLSNGAVSGFVAGTVRLTGALSATLQAARGFRDPLLSDRYFDGISGRGHVVGNPELEPEASRQFDAALRWQRGPVRVALFGYDYRLIDLIERWSPGADPADPSGRTKLYRFRNRGDARLRGLELEADVHFGHGLQLVAGAQYQRGRSLDRLPTDRTDALDDVPPTGAFVVLRREPKPTWGWMVRAAAYRRDTRPGPNEMVIPGYAILDAGLSYTLSRAFELQLLGRNALDHAYFGTADEKAVLAPGRTLELTLRGKL